MTAYYIEGFCDVSSTPPPPRTLPQEKNQSWQEAIKENSLRLRQGSLKNSSSHLMTSDGAEGGEGLNFVFFKRLATGSLIALQ